MRRDARHKTDGRTRMNITRSMCSALLVLAGLTWQLAALAQDGAAAAASAPAASAAAGDAAASPAGPGTEYSEKGADTCLACHDPESDAPPFVTAGIFKTRHAHRGDARAPFGPGNLQCEACHGPGARHSSKGSKKTLTINSLKANSFLAAPQRNEPCLTCHQDRARSAWHVGAHDRNQVACTDCHQMHVERDAVLAKDSQREVCSISSARSAAP